MSELLSRDDARELLEIVLFLSRRMSLIELKNTPPKPPEHWQGLLGAEGRALKLLAKLSQPQSLGSQKE